MRPLHFARLDHYLLEEGGKKSLSIKGVLQLIQATLYGSIIRSLNLFHKLGGILGSFSCFNERCQLYPLKNASSAFKMSSVFSLYSHYIACA